MPDSSIYARSISLAMLVGSTASAQWAPTGYMGAVSTPSAQTLPVGSVLSNWSNNVPEQRRAWPGVGSFGSFGLGMGLIPDLEMSVRLAYDGDLSCSMYAPNCKSSMRDLSMGGKYQLPLELPLNSRLAVGVSDVGGAATRFRQAYAVLTSRQAAWDWSMGYGKASSTQALLRGPFASVSWWATERSRLVLEHDSKDIRAGVDVLYPLSAKWQLAGSLSHKLSDHRATQKAQAGLSLIYSWERDHDAAQSRRYNPLANLLGTAPLAQRPWRDEQAKPLLTGTESPSSPPTTSVPGSADATEPPQAQRPQFAASAPTAEPARDTALGMAKALEKAGYTQVRIGQVAGLWVVHAEPTAWRKSHSKALARGITTLLPHVADGERFVFSLSFAQLAHRSVSVIRGCAAGLHVQCLQTGEHAFSVQEIGPESSSSAFWLLEPGWDQQWAAHLELGPALRHTAGTEYGLIDHSFGLDLGWEIPIAGVKGMLWQGALTQPLSNSRGFAKGGVFESQGIKQQVQQSMLSYLWLPRRGTMSQISWGDVTPYARGSQFDAAWLSADARSKLALSAGRYKDHHTPLLQYRPQLAQWRYELAPGLWAVQLAAGRFLQGDAGWQLNSEHWFSQHRISLHLRSSGAPEKGLPNVRFAGFTISLPIGPEKSTQWGRLSIRGRDLWSDGLQSKVGASDNYISTLYGNVPQIRHGLSDLLDHDRRWPVDTAEGMRRLRLALQQD